MYENSARRAGASYAGGALRSVAPMLSVIAAIPLLATPGTANSPTLRWADQTVSPRPSTGEPPVLAACPQIDRALDEIAAKVATHSLPASDVEALTYALRAAGEPHVWPRAWMLEGKNIDLGEANTRLDAWLGGFRHVGRLRCGIARSKGVGRETIAAVAVDAEADLARVPMRARTSSWIDLDARVLVPASGAKVVVLGPTGTPRTLPTSFVDGRVRARANVDQPGSWLFQVLLDGDQGPRPVLEALVFAGVEPPASQPWSPAPGEEAAASGDPEAILERMLAAARQTEALAPHARQVDLDRIAQAHTERMIGTGGLAHDAGDGNPKERAERAGVIARDIGENVAHAGSVTLAHRALWSSPSHRANMLDRRFDRVGIGAVTAPDGSVWVTELFAR
jgi:Cysteine-rich secretory protein family